MDNYKHYIRVNEKNEVILAYPEWTNQYQEGDILWRESSERHVSLQLVTMDGVWKYLWDGKDVIEKAQAVIESETLAIQNHRSAMSKLYELDLKSIRDLREYVAKQQDAPTHIKQYESEAVSERAKLR